MSHNGRSFNEFRIYIPYYLKKYIFERNLTHAVYRATWQGYNDLNNLTWMVWFNTRIRRRKF